MHTNFYKFIIGLKLWVVKEKKSQNECVRRSDICLFTEFVSRNNGGNCNRKEG